MRIAPLLAIAVAGLAAACGDSGSDSLLGGGGASTGTSIGSGSGGESQSFSPTGDDAGAASGDEGDGGARTLFEALLPSFDATCGGSCHQQGTTDDAPAYLGGADPYSTIKSYPGIVVSSAQQSVLLTKGLHEGPALTGALQTSITQWLTAEATALAASGPPVSAPITIATGDDTVSLSSLGVPGASLSFTAAVTGDILTLSNLQLAAPVATGLSVTFPIFYVNAPGAQQAENDDMSNVQQDVAAGNSATLGTGILIVTGWATGDTLQISFTKLSAVSVAADDGGAGATGGCKALASFTANAVPAIQANTCLTCHNTGGSGNPSLDLSGLAANPPNYAAACAQALTRADPADPAQSDIILAPTGQVANHPFKNASATFATMMETWIQAEN